MKIATLCDFPYWEGNIGSAVRYESLCQSLTQVCDLTMICSVALGTDYHAFARHAPYRLIDRGVLKDINVQLGNPTIPGVRPDRQVTVCTIKHLCETEGFDAVVTPYFNRYWMVEHIPRDILRVIDTHDCQSHRTRSFAAHGLTPTFIMNPESEGKELGKYDIALSMSDEDTAEFSNMTTTPAITAPFRLPPHPIYRARETGAEVLFIAAKSPVNDLTLAYLLRDVLPLVNRNLTLHVVGNVTIPDAPPSVNIKLVHHTDVADLAWIYGAMDLALNPTYAGGGVKTKTLEAISYGVPVITTDEGARGLRNLLPNLLIANDKESFAYKIGMLLNDSNLREQISQQMLSNLIAERKEDWLQPFVHLVRAGRAARLEGQQQ